MKLYTYWRSSSAYRVRIALNLKDVEYESVPVHLVKDGGQQKSAEYLKLNPQGLVPVLVDGDTVLRQSLAIIEYLDEKYPRPPLLPESAKGRARVRGL
ncbi:MAG: maleylacetoacetate isomerase, partial [Gammaproteobacteria bacterium]